MNDPEKLPISVQPVISYPREAEIGKTYLMEIDLKQTGDFGEWTYEEEEYPIYFRVDTYSDSREDTTAIFKIKTISEPAVILHRFGGTYGAAKFLLTAASKEMKGEIRVTLVNGWGVSLKMLRLEVVSIAQEGNKDDRVADEKIVIIKTLKKLELFEFEAEVATIAFEPVIIDYNHLEKLLIDRQWQEADRETGNIILKATNQEQRGWLDEFDLQQLPSDVLQILDRLWIEYSQGHFGFSVQKQIWLSAGCQPGQDSEQLYQRFGQRVGWYDSKMERWLMWDEYTFSLEAHRGHLPRYLPSQGTKIRPVLFGRQDLLVYTDLLSQNLRNFSFETPTVNRRGEIIKTTTHTANCFTETLPNNVDLDMVSIPGGTFTMGSPKNEKDSRNNERPQHNVTVPPFFIGKYPITQGQWQAIASRTDLKVKIDLDEDPSYFKEPYQKDQETIERWQRPVENVNWYEAVEFCQRLSKLTRRDYRLPSEAQWEYACRAMTEPLDLAKGESYQPFYFGETLTDKLANYNASRTYADEPKGEGRNETTPVGQFPPNAFGLYDMHGNVWEWCMDDWHDNYDGAPTDGSAWLDSNQEENAENSLESTEKADSAGSLQDENNPYSVMRGGSWGNDPLNCRSAIRNGNFRRDYHNNNCGFRVVCVFGRTL